MVNKKFWIVLVFLLTLAIPGIPSNPPSPEATSAYVEIGDNSAGSATCVSCKKDQSLFLTCSHVAPDDKVKYWIHKKNERIQAFRVASSERNSLVDLACLAVKGNFPVARIAKTDVTPGDLVFQFGFGGRNSKDNSTRKFGRVFENPFVEDVLTTRLNAEPGDSGAGIFDSHDELVGVCWGAVPEWVDQCGVPLEHIQKFLALTDRWATVEWITDYDTGMKTNGPKFVVIVQKTCPPCHALVKDIEENPFYAKYRSDRAMMKIDLETIPSWMVKYFQIKSTPTVFLVSKNDKIEREFHGCTKDTLPGLLAK